MRAFFRITTEWGLTDTQRLTLLGNAMSTPTLHAWRQRAPSTVSDDQLTRLSYVVGIYHALERMFRGAPEHARQWLSLERSDEPFWAISPLEYVLSGSVEALASLRQYVDAANGGPAIQTQ